MNAGYISAFATLAGSLIGGLTIGLTTFAAAWVTQRQQANVQWLLQEKTRRQELYQQFIEEASKLHVDALHDQAENPPLIEINKMRVVSNPGIARHGRSASLFIDFLEEIGAVEPRPACTSTQDPALLLQFREWMRSQRGTLDSTLNEYRRLDGNGHTYEIVGILRDEGTFGRRICDLF